MKREADVIVVGSGAGGATIAKELARRGREVLVLERGRDHRHLLGTHLGAALMADRFGMRFSNEGLQCVRGITAGGSTLFTCGTYRAPAPFIAERLGIDLSAEIAETRRELGVAPLPERFLRRSSLPLLEAADRCGYHWEVFEKFIDAERCDERCSRCMLGCPTGAKWTARRFLDEARGHGAEIATGVAVEKVLHGGGRARGVLARQGRELIELRAELVVLAAGGMGSAPILQRSGIRQAGRGVFIDPLVVVCGAVEGGGVAGTCFEPPMSVGSWEFYEDEGFMLAPLIDPWALFAAQMALVSPLRVAGLLRYRRTLGIMTKIKDDLAGQLLDDETFSKPLTEADRRKLDRGAAISEEILAAAGCSPRSIVRTPVRGAHPGGTCRIGQVVDHQLKTLALDGLYVADASVFPEALGTPVVATVVAMSKRLARHLAAEDPRA